MKSVAITPARVEVYVEKVVSKCTLKCRLLIVFCMINDFFS